MSAVVQFVGDVAKRRPGVITIENQRRYVGVRSLCRSPRVNARRFSTHALYRGSYGSVRPEDVREMSKALTNEDCANVGNRPAILTLVPVPEGIKAFRYRAHRSTGFSKIAQERHEVGVCLVCAANVRGLGGLLPFRSSFGCKEVASVPEFHAARLSRRKARLCPFGDEPPLVFSHSREDVYREAIRVRIIARYEFDTAFKEL